MRADESYAWDANGNRIGDGYVVGLDNRLLSDGIYWYDYDAEGNRTARFIDADKSQSLTTGDTEVTEYVWDHRNRLVRVKQFAEFASISGSPEQVVDYIYDVENRRIGSLYDWDGDGTIDREERYVWDGKNVVLDFVDPDGGNNGEESAPLALATRYLWGPAVDQLLAQEDVLPDGTTEVKWTLGDHLNTTRDIVDSSGTVVSHYTYDSFGAAAVTLGSLSDTRYLFTGQEYDAATATYYYDARWYDPRSAKFISLDPTGFEGKDANPTRYCGNSPAMFVDPSGLKVYKMVAPRNVYTEYFYAANNVDAAAEAENALCKLVPLRAAEASLVPHCMGIVRAEKELATVLTAANNAKHGYGRGGACGTWVTNVCKLLPATFPAQKTKLKVTPVWFRQGSPSIGSGYAMVFNAGSNWVLDWVGFGNGSGYDPANADWAPGHYALKIVFPDGYVVYFDNGWAGTGGTFSYHPGEIRPPGPPLGDPIPTVSGEPGWPE